VAAQKDANSIFPEARAAGKACVTINWVAVLKSRSSWNNRGLNYKCIAVSLTAEKTTETFGMYGNNKQSYSHNLKNK
jgi:hypothetical protein